MRATVLFVLGLGTRLPLRGRYLFNWDALQFALGMQRFDLAAHRPHPPGYIGYIALGRWLGGFGGGDVQLTMSTLSAVAAGLTVAAAYLLARRLFGEFSGVAAAVVMLTSPLFWFYGETALTYGLEPLLSLAGFWLAWRAWRRGGPALLIAGLGIGLMGALRPSCEVFLLPLLGFVAVRRGEAANGGRADLCVAAAGVAAGTVAWLLPLLVLSGGPVAYVSAGLQLGGRVAGGSAIWSAGIDGVLKNVQGVADGALLSLGLLPAVALAGLAARLAERGPRPPRGLGTDRLRTLGVVWVTPALVTYCLVHIGQLAYVLFALPAAALAAGPVLTQFGALLRPRARHQAAAVLLAGVALANLALFLTPITRLADQLRQRDEHVAALLDTVRHYPLATTLLLADPEGPGSYRLAQYYLPAYSAVAVGRDARGHAGEMFADHGGAPEYDIARFNRAGKLASPSYRSASSSTRRCAR